MINSIEELKKIYESLKTKQDNLISELSKKKSEIDNMALGLDKYKEKPVLLSQVEEIIKQRYYELRFLNEKINALGEDIKKAQKEISMFQVKKEIKKESILSKPIVNHVLDKEPVKISTSKAAEVALGQALKAHPKAEESKDTEVKIGHKKPVQKDDLYKKAAKESAGQDAYLKEIYKNKTNYGNA